MQFIRILVLLSFILPIKHIRACVGTDVLVDVTQVSCNSGNDGSIRVVPSFIAQNLPYTYSFNGGAFLSNNSISGLTAGQYQVRVKNDVGCEYTLSDLVEITEPQALSVQVLNTPIICGNDAKVFANISGGVGPYLYTWNNDPTMKMDTIRGINDGSFNLEVTDQNGCKETGSLNIPYADPFTVEIIADKTEIQIGDLVQLSSTVNRPNTNYSYQWYPDSDMDCSTCNETSSRFFSSTDVILVVHDLDNGCVDRDTVAIEVEGSFSLYIPNAFSPNGDSRNERFLVYGVGILTATLNIYDKNGFSVYTGEGLLAGWDGTTAGNSSPAGLYFYHANVVYTDGTIREQKGQISLIR